MSSKLSLFLFQILNQLGRKPRCQLVENQNTMFTADILECGFFLWAIELAKKKPQA